MGRGPSPVKLLWYTHSRFWCTHADGAYQRFKSAKARELTGINAVADADGNMLGSGMYDFSASDAADLNAALQSAANTRSAADDTQHADAIFGATSHQQKQLNDRR